MAKHVQVVVVGSVALDSIATVSERRKDLLGGSCSYACAASSLFARTGMVGVVGTDFPSRHVQLYTKLGIHIAGLQTVPGKTFRWSGVYEKDMINRRTLSTHLNVFASFSPQLPADYQNAPFVLLGNIAPDLQLHVLSQARKPRFVVADTMDLWINIARKPLMKLISRVNMVTLNDGEARLLTGEHNLRKAAADILRAGPEYVVIKKGEHGAILFSRKGIFIVPAYPIDEVVDPTGAGDTFAGSFIGALAGHKKIDEKAVRESLLYGAVVASFCCEAFSLNALARLKRSDVAHRLLALRDMTSCG
jgi:sugar/nucleoside kinase (ribokinase family)